MKVFSHTVNRWLGQLLDRFGYSIQRTYRSPQCCLPIVEIAVAALLRDRQFLCVQIGVYDGIISDPLYRILQDPRIRAVLVEPQPTICDGLRQRFKDSSNVAVVEAAINKTDGVASLYLPLAKSTSQLASLSHNHVAALTGSVKAITVRTVTVQALLEIHSITNIDLLQIDAEGSDFEILQQFFSLDVEPSIINLESFHLSKHDRAALVTQLRDRNYFFADYNLDTIAIKQDLIQSLSFGSDSSI